MKREIMIIAALLLCLTGCGRDTMVFIPEEAMEAGEGVVVHIPVDPDKPTEEAKPTEPSEAAEPTETGPEQTNSDNISKKPGSSSNKGNSSTQSSSANKETITGSPKPAETKPAETEPEDEKNQTTVTKPPVTEPPATEPPATEPPPTEPPPTEPPVTEPPLYDISGYVVSDLEYVMLALINEQRAEEGFGELYLDEYLCAVASCRSYEASRVWSHTRPDGRGYETVLSDYGYGGGAAGELLGYSTGDAATVVDKWMRSESHRALLMSGSSTLGIGIYYDGGVIYVACLLVG